MKSILLTIFGFFMVACLYAQSTDSRFQAAYQSYPNVTEGILEAVAWTNTHMVHLDDYVGSCSGMPKAYGIMGLHDNGQGYFIENGRIVERISGITVIEQKASAEQQILAYAAAYSHLINTQLPMGGEITEGARIRNVLNQLSEIPDSGVVNLLARDMHTYSVLRFLNSRIYSIQYGFNQHQLSLKSIFGEDNFEVLSSKKVTFTEHGIYSDKGVTYKPTFTKSIEYGPAIWNPAPSCNFSSRSGTAISAITIHTIQGSYSGAISWSQNCVSNVSFHYVIRSSDGQVTQMVLEADKGWHVGSENPYTIGYEHEGYVSDPSWYTESMYNSSADLSRDIVGSGYGIPPLRTYYGASSLGVNVLGGCTKIKGHQHFPNQTHTDPGINWDWEKYYKLINNLPSYNVVTAGSGSLYDTGGASGVYQDDERELWLIQPTSATSVTVNFTAFDLEIGYDNMFIYDGDNPDSPLIGSYTGVNSPGIVSSTGGSLLIEFRSDCGTVAPGWEATYSSTLGDETAPLTSIQADAGWHTTDFTVDFTDSDLESGIAQKYYHIIHQDVTDNGWNSNSSYGFINEDFEDNSSAWTNQTGTYAINAGNFDFAGVTEQNSNTYATLTQDGTTDYLFEWNQNVTSTSSSQRAGLHFFCDDATLPNRGNSYFVYLRESDDLVQIYRVTSDVFQLYANDTLTIDNNTWYNCKVSYSPTTGMIKVYVDGNLVTQWQDPTPLTSGNAVSFRTGGCDASFDDLHVYRSRGAQITVPAGITETMAFESVAASETGRVNSIVIDSAGNWSLVVTEDYLLDFSVPTLTNLFDGSVTDIDTFYTSTIEANWDITDVHSGILDYEFAIGTLPNLDDVAPWTSNGLLQSLSYLLSSPVIDQVYHISIRATNLAGLESTFTSNGQRYVVIDSTASLTELFNEVVISPNPANEYLMIEGLPGEVIVILYDATGKICQHSGAKDAIKLNVQDLSAGTYQVVLQQGRFIVVKRVVIQH